MKEQRFDHNRPPILPVPGEDPSWALRREAVYGDGLLALQEAEIAKQRTEAQARLEAQIDALRTGTNVQEPRPRAERSPLMIEGGSVTSEVMLTTPVNSAAEAVEAMSTPAAAAEVQAHKAALFGRKPSAAAAVKQD